MREYDITTPFPIAIEKILNKIEYFRLKLRYFQIKLRKFQMKLRDNNKYFFFTSIFGSCKHTATILQCNFSD